MKHTLDDMQLFAWKEKDVQVPSYTSLTFTFMPFASF